MPKKHLIIVESPAKARTIGRYLGADYDVAASVGHVRDLPTKELGVDTEGDFEPTYVTIRGKGKVLAELKAKAKGAQSIILATDPDREGEAIAYHVAEQLGYTDKNGRFQRVQFREITKSAVQEALASPGRIDIRKVEAQQARRILDRLVGYQVSPFLWKPIRPGLSAGRVQTVALRLICEREVEIRGFVSQEYWTVTAHLEKDGEKFEAKLHKIDGRAFALESGDQATAVVEDVRELPFRVTDLKRRERRKNPSAPFTTSTLQQEAAKRLRYSAKRTMSLAQRLYEGVELGKRGAQGLITYMRTDSTRVSAQAVSAARDWIGRELGDDYVSGAPRYWSGKQQRGAQEAHEAIRPTMVELHPSEAARFLDGDAAALYELVWLRFVASQMAPAVYDTTTLDFGLTGARTGRGYLFRATGSVVKFQGFTRLYMEATELGDHRRLDDLDPLPAMALGDVSTLERLEPKQHFTQPPPRFSEASLVKALEELGIGRPSTYAQIISTLQDRGYAEIEQRRFTPTDLGEVVAKLLVKVFPWLFDVDFTSRMEGQLDRVEDGDLQWQRLLHEFYPKLQERLQEGQEISEDIVKEIFAVEGETCDVCGRPMLVRFNKRGSFLGCSGYPECRSTRPVTPADVPEEPLGSDEETGQPIHLKIGPYGPYLEVGVGDDSKPRRVSIPEEKDLGDVDLEYARRMLSLPRTVGEDPDTGEEIVAGLGRYGPYVRRGKTFANLRAEADMFAIGLDEARRLIAERLKGAPRVIQELGPHPDSGKVVQIVSGRYGPYATDGSVNATLPKDADPEAFTLGEAVEILAKKAARKGPRGRGRRRSG
ncbi:MAG TPA: type I DNA topoisomerase [Longimicrobiales bacterium]